MLQSHNPVNPTQNHYVLSTVLAEAYTHILDQQRVCIRWILPKDALHALIVTLRRLPTPQLLAIRFENKRVNQL